MSVGTSLQGETPITKLSELVAETNCHLIHIRSSALVRNAIDWTRYVSLDEQPGHAAAQ